MFDFVRNNNRAMQVLLGLVLVLFALGGGGMGYREFFNEANREVASVDGKKISRAEWDNEHRRAVEELRRQGPNADLKALDTPAAKRASLDSIIKDRVLQAAEFHEGLTVSDSRLDTLLRTSPQFAQLRQLEPAQRQAVLANQGLTEDGFYERIRDQIGKGQVLDGVTQSGIVPATSAKAGLDAWFDQRDIQWQRFDTKDYAAKITPTDAQVQAYYADKAHAAEFEAPEEAKIQYVVFDVDALKSQMTASPDEVKNYYEQNKSHYTVEEERRASHILVAVDPKASPADVVKAKARADALLAEVRKNPANFAEIAKKESDDGGSKAQGGDLDYLTKKTAPPGPFADTLFSMKEGQISDVVRSPAGFHIIEMTGSRGGAVRPFEEVRPQIEDMLRTQLAQKAYSATADKFTNVVFETTNALPTTVKADDGSNSSYTLKTQTAVVHRKPEPGATGPLASTRLLDAVFANDAVQSKHNTEAIETGPSQLVSARVIEYHPERMRPLAEVHDQVVEAVRKELAEAAAKKDGEARVEAARKDASLALPLTATVGRMTSVADVPRPVVDAALKADISKGPVVAGVALPDGGYAAIRVVKNVPRSGDEQQNAQAKAQLESAFEDAVSHAVYDSLKARYKTSIDEDRVARGIASGTASN